MNKVTILKEQKSLDKLELSPIDRIFVEERTQKIWKAGNDCLHSYREMGKHLYDVKTLLEHGKFQQYVTDVLGMAPRTASDSVAIYLNTKEWEPAQLENVDISAAREMMKKEFPEERKTALLEKAKEGIKVTHKEVKKVVRAPEIPQEATYKVEEEAKKKVSKIAKKIAEPKYDDQRLPPGVTVIFEDPHQKLSTIKKGAFDAIIFEFSSLHQAWLQEHYEDFERILKDDGELIIITQQEFIPILIMFFDSTIRYNGLLVSRTEYVIDRDPQKEGMLLYTIRFSNWLNKNKDKQHPKITDYIPSDSEYHDKSIVVKRNEVSYLVGNIVPQGGNVLCLCTTTGYIEEAAYIEGVNVTVMLEPQSQELANLTYRLSGYAG